MHHPSKAPAAALALGFLLAPPAAGGPIKKISLVTVPATQQLKASPERVWTVLTSVEGLATLTGVKVTGDLESFAAVGDNVAAEVWGETGRLLVTDVLPQRGLRIVFAPTKGDYFCDKVFALSAWEGGTTLQYTDRYADENDDAKKTAQRAADQTQRGIEAFKKLVEQP
jgi:hypothetical protein